jgi:hypothetical protein
VVVWLELGIVTPAQPDNHQAKITNMTAILNPMKLRGSSFVGFK